MALQKINYLKFIQSKKHRPLIKEQGYEFHHIIPRSLGGSNKKENLVKLTHSEHLKAHEYLAKMYKGENKLKMDIALGAMKSDRTLQRKTSLKLWEKDSYRQQQVKVHKQWARKNRDHYSNEMKRRWQDPEFRAKVLAKRKKIYADPEWKKRTSLKRKLKWQDPEYRSKVTASRWY